MAEEMAAAEVGFDDGISWLPSHVIHEALIAENRNRRCSPIGSRKVKIDFDSHCYSIKSYSRERCNNKAHGSGGPGMQAIFLDSGQRTTSGTGVFIPSTKPAFSPVLLPFRVVRALNLDLNALGSIKASHRDIKHMKFDYKRFDNNDDVLRPSPPQCEKLASSEVLLPKEWTY